MRNKLFGGVVVLASLVGVLQLIKGYQHFAKVARFQGELKRAHAFKDSLFRADNIDTLRIYTQSIGLQFHGKPLVRMGQPLASLPTALHYHRDEMSDIGG